MPKGHAVVSRAQLAAAAVAAVAVVVSALSPWLPRGVGALAGAVVALAVLGILTLVVIHVLDTFTPLAGLAPAMHATAAWGLTLEDVPDLTGKTALVTGCNSGLGFGTAKLLALKGATVVMTCRTKAKGETAKAEMLADERFNHVPGGKDAAAKRLIPMELDLTSFANVAKFIDEFKATGMPIHTLIANAGALCTPFSLSTEGIELNMAVNHFAHALLVLGLLDVVKKSSSATIVMVSSIGHVHASMHNPPLPLTMDAVNDEKKFNALLRYDETKLANLLFAKELQRRLDAAGVSGVFVNAVHPGGVRGGFHRHMLANVSNPALSAVVSFISAFAMKFLYWPEEDAALTNLAPAVTAKAFAGAYRGEYFVPIARVSSPTRVGSDPKLAKELWEFTENVAREKGWKGPLSV